MIASSVEGDSGKEAKVSGGSRKSARKSIRLHRRRNGEQSGTDPLSLSAAVVVLVLAGLVAGYLPARRASRVDPLTPLRYE
ncbi:MAG TPA: hypothetical protein VG267_14220 [Terracidiphilus sp.]|nr:hypothetical protein [Terracidiphilus sp.]